MSGLNSIDTIRVCNRSVVFDKRSFLVKRYRGLNDFAYFLQHTKENFPDTIYRLLRH